MAQFPMRSKSGISLVIRDMMIACTLPIVIFIGGNVTVQGPQAFGHCVFDFRVRQKRVVKLLFKMDCYFTDINQEDF